MESKRDRDLDQETHSEAKRRRVERLQAGDDRPSMNIAHHEAETTPLTTIESPRTSYQYEPFSDSHGEQIRLLRVWRSHTGAVSCSLQTCSLDEHEYHALSYTWGPEHPTYNIEIDGKEFQIRENLYWFLHHCALGQVKYYSRRMPTYRHETSCYLWIDQISINQESIAEKSQQVQFMSEIYRTASTVIIWLGKDTGGGKECIDFLREGPDNYRAQFELSDEEFSAIPPSMRFGARLRKAARLLGEQPYVKRRWIIQEFALARKFCLLWGASGVGLEESDLVFVLSRLHLNKRNEDPFEHLFDLRGEVLAAGPKGLDRPLIEIAAQFIDSECGDPHDIFYALQGLLRKEHRIPVDYDRTVEDIFWDAVTAAPPPDGPAMRNAIGQLIRRLDITGTSPGATRHKAIRYLLALASIPERHIAPLEWGLELNRKSSIFDDI